MLEVKQSNGGAMARRFTSFARRAAVVTVAFLTFGGIVTVSAAPAQADKIDKWSSWWQPCKKMCLYYSPGLKGGCWSSNNVYDGEDLSSEIFDTCAGTGTAGVNQAVGGNAASMGNGTTNCNVTAWYYPGWIGYSSADENWLHPGWAGNLTSRLRNNEYSIEMDNCT
ncbi:MAG TPA: hypothetical protein VGD29_28915 [Actinoplanes sp.]|jgi:hypothetical protein